MKIYRALNQVIPFKLFGVFRLSMQHYPQYILNLDTRCFIIIDKTVKTGVCLNYPNKHLHRLYLEYIV